MDSTRLKLLEYELQWMSESELALFIELAIEELNKRKEKKNG